MAQTARPGSGTPAGSGPGGALSASTRHAGGMSKGCWETAVRSLTYAQGPDGHSQAAGPARADGPYESR